MSATAWPATSPGPGTRGWAPACGSTAPVPQRRSRGRTTRSRRSASCRRCWTEPGCISGRIAELPADGAVRQLAEQVGLTVVTGVLLNHVHVDPAQRYALAEPLAFIAELPGCRIDPALLALLVPDGQISVPVRPVEGNELDVIALHAGPDMRRLGCAQQDPAEPVALDLGHVPDQ